MKGHTVARTIAFVPTLTNNGGSVIVPLASIPQDVKDDLEEAYEALKANPSGRFNVVFGDKKEAHQFETWAKSYCAQRTIVDPAGDVVEAPIRFRKSPTKGLPANQIDFRISDIVADEVETEESKPEVETPAPAKPKARTARKPA